MTPRLLPRLRSTIAVVVVAWLLVGAAGAHCDFPRFESHSARPSHSSVTAVGSEGAVNVDHTVLTDGSRLSCPAKLATAETPRSATSLVALGAVMAVVASAGLFADLMVAADRGPPSASVYPLTGQALLTRFCVARR